MSSIAITAFYTFLDIPERDLPVLQEKLAKFGEENSMRGLVLLAKEGVNGTVCAKPAVIEAWKRLLQGNFAEITFKDSTADKIVFPRWFVKIRKEIVSLKQPDICPKGKYHHLSPEEWDRTLQEEDVLVIDTRNDYETEVGMFEGALDPKLREFHEFPEFVKKAKLPKDKKILMYCTGGIRCEKASLEMKKQGYEHVYQLEGGILAYLQKFPNKKFRGECFVFDHRVAVDQELQPSSRYCTCPHCGNPGDVHISCARCGQEKSICSLCHEKEERRTCSKDCRNRLSNMVPGLCTSSAREK